MSTNDFREFSDLSQDTELVRAFDARCRELFAMVEARHPERGIATLVGRARTLAQSESIPFSVALDTIYAAAEVRTHARLRLMQCRLPVGEGNQ
jgi:hypothetical protein